MLVLKELEDLKKVDWDNDDVDDGLWVFKNLMNRPFIIVRRDFGEGDYRAIEIDNGLTMNNHLARDEFNTTQLNLLIKKLISTNCEVRFYENNEWNKALNWLIKREEI